MNWLASSRSTLPGPERQGAGAAQHRRDPRLARERRGGPVPLQPDGPELAAVAPRPAHGLEREVAGAGAHVEQGQAAGQGAAVVAADLLEPAAHGPPPAEPAVGAGNVVQRLPHHGRVGRGVVEQLAARGQARTGHGRTSIP
ncbi:MAG: hypothetical protein IPK12_02505 [Gemmatimonadetes bacterium]|nr:hypothetical protein [Gemmatimonadota bacterium]